MSSAIVKALPKDAEEVHVTSVEDAATFWVMEPSKVLPARRRIQILEFCLKRRIEDSPAPLRCAPDVDELVAVRNPITSLWSRARVRSFDQKTGLYSVFLLDHGTSMTADMKSMRELPGSMQFISEEIFKVILFGLVPLKCDGNFGNSAMKLQVGDKWSKEANSLICREIDKSEISYVVTKVLDEERKVIFGEVYLVTENGFLNLSLLLEQRELGIVNHSHFAKRYPISEMESQFPMYSTKEDSREISRTQYEAVNKHDKIRDTAKNCASEKYSDSSYKWQEDTDCRYSQRRKDLDLVEESGSKSKTKEFNPKHQFHQTGNCDKNSRYLGDSFNNREANLMTHRTKTRSFGHRDETEPKEPEQNIRKSWPDGRNRTNPFSKRVTENTQKKRYSTKPIVEEESKTLYFDHQEVRLNSIKKVSEMCSVREPEETNSFHSTLHMKEKAKRKDIWCFDELETYAKGDHAKMTCNLKETSPKKSEALDFENLDESIELRNSNCRTRRNEDDFGLEDLGINPFTGTVKRHGERDEGSAIKKISQSHVTPPRVQTQGKTHKIYKEIDLSVPSDTKNGITQNTVDQTVKPYGEVAKNLVMADSQHAIGFISPKASCSSSTYVPHKKPSKTGIVRTFFPAGFNMADADKLVRENYSQPVRRESQKGKQHIPQAKGTCSFEQTSDSTDTERVDSLDIGRCSNTNRYDKVSTTGFSNIETIDKKNKVLENRVFPKEKSNNCSGLEEIKIKNKRESCFKPEDFRNDSQAASVRTNIRDDFSIAKNLMHGSVRNVKAPEELVSHKEHIPHNACYDSIVRENETTKYTKRDCAETGIYSRNKVSRLLKDDGLSYQSNTVQKKIPPSCQDINVNPPGEIGNETKLPVDEEEGFLSRLETEKLIKSAFDDSTVELDNRERELLEASVRKKLEAFAAKLFEKNRKELGAMLHNIGDVSNSGEISDVSVNESDLNKVRGKNFLGKVITPSEGNSTTTAKSEHVLPVEKFREVLPSQMAFKDEDSSLCDENAGVSLVKSGEEFSLATESEENLDTKKTKEIVSAQEQRDDQSAEAVRKVLHTDEGVNIHHSEDIHEDDGISPAAENYKVSPATEDDRVSPTTEDDGVTPDVEDDGVTPAAEDKGVTPAVEEEDVTPAVEEKDVTPAVEEKDVTPAAEDKGVTPAVEEEDVTPAVEEVDVTPAVEEVDVTPAVEEEDVTPAVEEVVVTPAVEAEDVTPAVEAEDVTPAVEAEDVTPAVVAEDVTPAAEEEDGVKPAAEEEDGVKPAAEEEDGVTPAAEEEDVTPAAEEDGVSSAVKTDSITSAVEDDSVLPAAKDDGVSSASEDHSILPAAEGEGVSSLLIAHDISMSKTGVSLPAEEHRNDYSSKGDERISTPEISIDTEENLKSKDDSEFKDTCLPNENNPHSTEFEDGKSPTATAEGCSSRPKFLINSVFDPRCFEGFGSDPGQMFMDQLQSLVVLLHGAGPDFKPLNSVVDAGFRRDVHEALQRKRITRLFRLDRYAWPVIQQGSDLVLVGPRESGKTLGYLVPCIDLLLQNLSSDKIPKGSGPVLLVLCSGSKSCNSIQENCWELVRESTKDVKIVVAYGGGAEKVEHQLANGCHILISTPRCFQRLLAKGKLVMNFARLKYLVLDEADILTLRFFPEMELIGGAVKHGVQSRSGEVGGVQMVVIAEKWCPGVEGLARTLTRPIVCIGALLEAIAYARLQPQIHQVTEDTRLETLYKVLKEEGYQHKIMVVCEASSLAYAAAETLQDLKLPLLLATDDLESSEVHDLVRIWNRTAQITLVCTDAALQELRFRGTTFLVHLDLPQVSKTQFALRCGTLVEQLPIMFGDTTSRASPVPPRMHIFISDSVKEPLPEIRRFLKRLRITLDPDLEKRAHLAEIERERKKEAIPLCPYTKFFGDCWNKSACHYRHIFCEMDKPQNIPTSGTVKLSILNYLDACCYTARLLEHTDENGNTTTISNFVLKIVNGLRKHFRNSDNRVLLENPKAHDICAVEKYVDGVVTYERVELVTVYKVIKNQRCKWFVRYIDQGNYEIIQEDNLFKLPDALKAIAPQAVELVLSKLIPCDLDWSWGQASKECVLDILSDAADHDKFLVGKIVLALGHTLWLESLECYQHLPTLKTSTIKFSLRRRLLDEGVAVENPLHVQRLRSACAFAGLPCPSLQNASNSGSVVVRPEDKVEAQWAFLPRDEFSIVHFITGYHPSRFYVRLQKFEDLFCKLDKKLQKLVDEKSVKDRALFAGDFCIGRFPDDKMWYRARVEDAQDDRLELFFVDHGDRAYVSKSDAFPLPRDLIKQLPFQAIECSVAGISPLEGDKWSEESIDFLYDVTGKPGTVDGVKMLYAKLVGDSVPADNTGGKRYPVALVSCSDADKNLLNEAFVSKGVAKEIPELKALKESLDLSELNVISTSDSEIDDLDDEESPQFLQQDNAEFAETIIDGAAENWDNALPSTSESSMLSVNNVDLAPKENESVSPSEKEIEERLAEFNLDEIDEDEITEFFNACMSHYRGRKCLEAPSDVTENDLPSVAATTTTTKAIKEEEKGSVVDSLSEEDSNLSDTDTEEKDTGSGFDPCMPALISTTRRPQVLWHQSTYAVWVRVDLPGTEDYFLRWGIENLSFWTQKLDEVYAFDITLFGAIDPHKVEHFGGLFVQIKLPKLVLGVDWMRLTRQRRVPWVKIDYNAEHEREDEEEELRRQVNAHLKAVQAAQIKQLGQDDQLIIPADEVPSTDSDADSDVSDTVPFQEEQYDPYDPLN